MITLDHLECTDWSTLQLLAQAREAGEFLRVNVVQAVRTHDNTYSEWGCDELQTPPIVGVV